MHKSQSHVRPLPRLTPRKYTDGSGILEPCLSSIRGPPGGAKELGTQLCRRPNRVYLKSTRLQTLLTRRL